MSSEGYPLDTRVCAADSGLDVHLCLWNWMDFYWEDPRCLGLMGSQVGQAGCLPWRVLFPRWYLFPVAGAHLRTYSS